MKKKRPVLQDVADKVGVTKMTVSRYLRNPDQVSVALQQKIAVALDELGYIPNRAPDILSNATSRAIGVLLPSLTNQVFAEVLRGTAAIAGLSGRITVAPVRTRLSCATPTFRPGTSVIRLREPGRPAAEVGIAAPNGVRGENMPTAAVRPASACKKVRRLICRGRHSGPCGWGILRIAVRLPGTQTRHMVGVDQHAIAHGIAAAGALYLEAELAV